MSLPLLYRALKPRPVSPRRAGAASLSSRLTTIWNLDFGLSIARPQKYRLVCFAILASLFLFAAPAEAQHPNKIVTVGELLFRDRADLGAGRQVFRRQLRDLDQEGVGREPRGVSTGL
jgi:hypothetical protein